MGPSPRLLRAVDAERTALERQRAHLAREAAALRASLARVEAGMAEIDALRARLDGLAPGNAAERRATGPGLAAAGDGAGRVAAAGPADGTRGRGGGAAAGAGARGRAAHAVSPCRDAPPGPGPARRTLRGPEIRTTAVALLLADGREALHYRDWYDLLARAGYDVAGKDPLAVFLTQLTRSPAVRRGARPGEYVLDRGARATLQRRLDDLNRALATLPQQTTDLTELRTRRAQLTHEINRAEKALEELQHAA